MNMPNKMRHGRESGARHPVMQDASTLPSEGREQGGRRANPRHLQESPASRKTSSTMLADGP